MVCGLDCANCNYTCIWCKYSKDLRWDMDKSWSIYDVSLGARTTTELQSSKKYNSSRVPLFPFIPLDHVVIHTLHLFLRLSDLLINLLIQELQRKNGVNRSITKIDKSRQKIISMRSS